ncbi:hypothetical protein [Aporhodopirellula aestuarii]|uniref:Transcriptional regulator n=1 Tax=Aporhodopirellula aestuarii TaxID=2950107 RepID=A0ABT0TYP8_9BACT|nr:hypothetical protein [Aporhodopirellula aestuarii]MCM2369655.1 hypothetical protein [Aporhodopirellula aestuarii]
MTIESSRQRLIDAHPSLGQIDRVLLVAELLKQSRRDLTADEITDDVETIRGSEAGIPVSAILEYLESIGLASELDGQWRFCDIESTTHTIVDSLSASLR